MCVARKKREYNNNYQQLGVDYVNNWIELKECIDECSSQINEKKEKRKYIHTASGCWNVLICVCGSCWFTNCRLHSCTRTLTISITMAMTMTWIVIESEKEFYQPKKKKEKKIECACVGVFFVCVIFFRIHWFSCVCVFVVTLNLHQTMRCMFRCTLFSIQILLFIDLVFFFLSTRIWYASKWYGWLYFIPPSHNRFTLFSLLFGWIWQYRVVTSYLFGIHSK